MGLSTMNRLHPFGDFSSFPPVFSRLH